MAFLKGKKWVHKAKIKVHKIRKYFAIIIVTKHGNKERRIK